MNYVRSRDGQKQLARTPLIYHLKAWKRLKKNKETARTKLLKHANKSGCLIQGAVVLSSNQMELWLALGIHAFTLQIQTASG